MIDNIKIKISKNLNNKGFAYFLDALKGGSDSSNHQTSSNQTRTSLGSAKPKLSLGFQVKPVRV